MNTDEVRNDLAELPYDPFPSQIGVFEIQKQGESQTSDGEVPHHLGKMGGCEVFHDLGIDDYDVVDEQIWNERVNDLTLVEHLESLLLVDPMATVAQFDYQGVLISFLIQARFKSVEHFHGCADDRLTQFPMDYLIRVHPWNPWLKSNFSGLHAEAGVGVAGAIFDELGGDGPAAVGGEFAARREGAAGHRF